MDDMRSTKIRSGFVVYLELSRVKTNDVNANSTTTSENKNPKFSDMKGYTLSVLEKNA